MNTARELFEIDAVEEAALNHRQHIDDGGAWMEVQEFEDRADRAHDINIQAQVDEALRFAEMGLGIW